MSKKFTITIICDDIEGARSALFTATELIYEPKGVSFVSQDPLKYHLNIEVKDEKES